MSSTLWQFHGFIFAALLFGITACNTISGVGQDLEAAGEAIEETAEKKKTY